MIPWKSGRPGMAVGALLAAAAACTAGVAPEPMPSPVAVPSSTTPAPGRPRPYPIIESQEFQRAVERGTRTRTGEPGERYWQQYTRYRLEAELEPATRRVTGRAAVRYTNNSPDTLRSLFLHLHQNLFAPDAVRNEIVPVTGGMELRRVVADGRVLEEGEDGPRYIVSATRLAIIPERPVAPGSTAELEIDWAFTMPPDGAPRSGVTADSVWFVAYWYPQMAVYDDVNGWQIDPYMGNAEFYMGYGDYDVAITLPAGWLIGATGELLNPDEVLTPATRERLARARQTGEIVHVVADDDRAAGRSTSGSRGSKLTWRFRATGQRDFAFAASDKFLWDATIALVGDASGDGRPDTAAIHTLYRPQVREWAWDQSARYARHSVEFLSRYLWPYAYPHMTAVDGPDSCSGMEYPMITCIGGERDTLSLYSVTVHEIAHMWFPMQVGSDEKRYSWQDEGLTRFNQAQGMRDFFAGYDRERISRENYIQFTRTGDERELMRHGDLYPFASPAFGIASYDKMATNLVALRALLGDELFLRAYREYGRRWINKHPTPFDFWNTFNSVTGRDLWWFWRTWWYETWTLDQAIAGAREAGNMLAVTIEDRGLAPMPVRLTVTRRDGTKERLEVPVDVWLSGARQHSVQIRSAATVAAVEIDAERVFPDVNRGNNRWQR